MPTKPTSKAVSAPKKTEETASGPFAAVLQAFAKEPAISSTKMFGALGLKVCAKAFAMLYKGDLVVKLPSERVDALARAGTGKAFEPGMGRVMKEWVALGPQQQAKWVSLAKEARDFVAKSL